MSRSTVITGLDENSSPFVIRKKVGYYCQVEATIAVMTVVVLIVVNFSSILVEETIRVTNGAKTIVY